MKTHHKAILVACFCLPLMMLQARTADLLIQSVAATLEASPAKILQAAAPLLGMAYADLQGLYEDGCCTITPLGNDRYAVKVDGGDTCIIVITDD